MELKMRVDKIILSAQIVGEVDVTNETKVRIVIEDAGSSNTIVVRAKLKGQSNFTTLKTITGSSSEVINVFTYELLQIECTNYEGPAKGVLLIAASFDNAGGSTIESIGVPSGDDITEFEFLNFTSSDNSVSITGNNTTKTIDFSSASYSSDQDSNWNSPIPDTIPEALDQLAERMVDVEVNKIDVTEKGAANGVAPLNSISKIDSIYLPSYVDDVVEYASLSVFPAIGEFSKIYVALDTNLTYRWSGSGYIEVSAAPVTSVNGKTNAVVLDKGDIGLSEVDNTSDLDKPVSDATQLALDNLEESFTYNQVVYVDKSNTNTYTADGSINKPYKSIKAMYDAITDASASKRYACVIAPGTYVESPDIRLEGWIDLSAFATDTVIISTSDSSSLKWSNNTAGRVFIRDIGFSVGIETLNDNPTGSSGLVLDLDNVDVPSLVFNGRGGGKDFVQLRNDTRISGTCTIKSASTTIFDSTNISTLIMNDDDCLFPDSFGSAITASIRSNYIGSIQITANNYDVYTDIWGTIIAGNLSISSNASSYPCYFNHDVTSYPLGTVTLTGTNPAQIVRTSVAQSLQYNPAVSGNWTSPTPSEVKAALDNLALNKITTTQKGAANGVAPLNGSSKIDLSYIPSIPLSQISQSGADADQFAKWNGSEWIPANLEANKTNYTPSQPSNWSSSPDLVSEGLDELAGRLSSQQNISTDTNEPTGFLNKTSSQISFSNASRIFSISPVSGSFSFYIKGTKYTKTTTQSIELSNTEGNHYIYFNASGELSSTTVFSSSIIEQYAFVSVVYWSTSSLSKTYFADERHGITMDGVTHAYLHTVFGARYLSGLALQNFSVDGSGNLAAHAQFTADSGSIRDEDLLITINAQTQIPILYREGVGWKKKSADTYPVIYSGTAGYTGINGRLPFNQYISGSWQLTEISNSSYVLVHFFATNDIDNPTIGIQGVAEYNSISAARLNANQEITSLSGLPFTEFVAIGSVIFESATSYGNTPKARVISTDINTSYVDFRGTQLYTPAGEATTHGLLSGLSNDDHLQYHTDSRGDTRYYTKSQIDSTVTAINGYITNVQNDVDTRALDSEVIKKDGSVAFTDNQSLGNKRITELANPVDLTDAVNLQTLNSALGSSGDLVETSFNLSNNQTSVASVTGFSFSNSTVRSFSALVSVSILATTNLYEMFDIKGIQKESGWFISVTTQGDNSNINFTITSTGQIQYTSSNYSGFISGKIKFRAITTSV